MIKKSMVAREIDPEEKRVCVPTPMIQEPFFELPVLDAPIVRDTVVPTPIVSSLVATMNNDEVHVSQDLIETDATDEGEQQQPQTEDVPNVEVPRRSQKIRRSAIPDDFEVYNTEEFQMEDDSTLFEEAMRSNNSSKWLEAMEDEIKSMSTNKVWDLKYIPKGAKAVGCKWVYKTKHDFQRNIKRFKARLMAKDFTQREWIDYNKTFSPVLCKDSFRIIMALVAHYDLELHQMDVKTVFLNGDLEKNVYMAQPKGFVVEGKERIGCRLKKSIYGLKQASRQWYLKFNRIIRNFGFKENVEDNCVYVKFKNGKYIFLILYVDDILLASSDISLLPETKKFLSSKFDMKNLGEASFVLGIEIHRNKSKWVLGLS
jgi:hypothetical protein